MRKLWIKSPTLLLALLLWSPGAANAQLGEYCGRSGFLAACATLESISSSANTLTLTVFNSSDITDPDIFEDSYIGTLLLKFKDGTLASGFRAEGAQVTILDSPNAGRVGEEFDWRGFRNAGGEFGIMWDGKVMARRSAEGIRTGERASVVITFNQLVSDEDLELWAAQLRAIGSADNCPEGEQECSDWAVVPEPVTMVLLGTGLAGVGGAAALRRRRKAEIVTE